MSNNFVKLNRRKISKFNNLYKRGAFLIFAIILYRIGTHIPVPGINPNHLAQLFQSHSNSSILGMFNMFSGGALSRFTIFALGIMPYISSSIIIQLITMISPKLEEIKKDGYSGQRKIKKYTKYLTVLLSTFQACGIVIAMKNQPNLIIDYNYIFYINTVIILVTGTILLLWIGEQITERGLGNGISIIILSGIASGLPNACNRLFELVNIGSMSIFSAIVISFLIFIVTFLVVFVERGQRKIIVNYAKRQIGNKIYGGQSSHLPLKINMSGVIPPIFSSSIILFLVTVLGWFNIGTKNIFENQNNWIAYFIHKFIEELKPGQLIYIILYTISIIFFCFFYTSLVFNSRETADNLKKSGAFLPGIRPGEQTALYINRIINKLTLVGTIYILFVCLLPEFLVIHWNVPFYFGGTSLLIIVVVTIDFMSQIQSFVVSQQYESLLKKGNSKNRSNITIR